MEKATQQFLNLKDIRDGVLILGNNDIRGILEVSSINFALKSEEAQSSVIYSFQSFLNSLDFFCQIIIQSRSINITPYLDSIKAMEGNQTNELLKTQTSSYGEFIKELVKEDKIMTKRFYLVVPYSLIEALGVKTAIKQSIFPKLFGKKGGGGHMKDEDFDKSSHY